MRPPTAGEAAAAALAAPLAAWAGFVAAPALDGGGSLASLIAAFSDPFSTKPTAGGARWALLFLVLYAACAAAWLLTRRNLRPGEEHGSARWGDARRICHRYRGRDPAGDKLLTRNFRMSYDTHAHRRSMNTLVVGGSGAGKTRGFSLPNACQANTSMVVLDPKGEIVRAVGGLLESRGYEVRVLDLVRMERSHCYNPLSYIESDADAQRLNTNLFKATTPKGAQSQDPFWDTAAGMLHLALLLYLVHEAPPEERNYATLMEMLRAGEVREDDDDYASVLDELFDRLEMRDPGHIALKYYRSYRSGSAKTLKSIQVTLASRLEKFNLDALASLTATDELDLPSLGERKVALFAVIPDNDTSFNFLVSVLYTQLFQQLFALADGKHGGQLPVHVHFLMDEFANVSLPNDFEKILSTMRGRGVSGVDHHPEHGAAAGAVRQAVGVHRRQLRRVPVPGRQRAIHPQVRQRASGQGDHRPRHARQDHREGRQLVHQPADLGARAHDARRGAHARQLPRAALRARRAPHHRLKARHSAASRRAAHPRGRRAALRARRLPAGKRRRGALRRRCPRRARRPRLRAASCSTGRRPRQRSRRRRRAGKENQRMRKTTEGKTARPAARARLMAAIAVCAASALALEPPAAFAATDPIAAVDNLSTFIFGLIRSVGLILLGFGVVQVGMSLKSHDPSQRANGFLTLAGGVVITFAKEILDIIVG